MKRFRSPFLLRTAVIFGLAACGAVTWAKEKKGRAKENPPAATTTTATESGEPGEGSEQADAKGPVEQVALGARLQLADETLHRDFPAMALAADGTHWIAYIEHDGKADVLKLAHRKEGALETVATLSEAGMVHQPAIACTADGAVWTFWGQVDARDIVTLRARRFTGKLEQEITLAKSDASDTFADCGIDPAGRLWVVWQSMRRGQGDIYARWLPPSGEWSPELRVSKPEGGNWEPRVAFTEGDGAWIAYDSSRGGEFNLYLAQVGLDGKTSEQQLTTSPDYEARVSLTPAREGHGLWIAAERGRREWGRPQRGHDGNTGLNGERRILLGHFDSATKQFSEVAVPGGGAPAPRPALSVDLPAVTTDAEGNPWLVWRYYFRTCWKLAVSRYELATKTWSAPQEVPDSALSQDRHSTLQRDASGKLWLCWASDKRQTKAMQTAGVYLAALEAKLTPYKAAVGGVVLLGEPRPYLDEATPDRPREEHHTWKIGGKTYHLIYGDLHRHTDFSNCRMGQDGCVLEHFRYAYDIAGLDFMGTSDHTDAAKRYDPYEWWQTQRLVDVFYAPEKFTSLYAYEREQSFPWGHRNVVFAQRGGPVVYISRRTYAASPWNALFPVAPGAPQISPMELWDVLKQYGQPTAVISHTGATSMGTDWERYDRVDYAVENTVEIFQGARVSCEGRGAPQPTVGLRKGDTYTADTHSEARIPAPPAAIEDFGQKRNNGVYQRALQLGHKLGVFASSDHISQHTSFGGVYVEEISRKAIIEAFQARRSIAATNKIFVEFSCNGKPMGSIFEASGKPELTFAVNGTAPLKKVTLVRNEENYREFQPEGRDAREQVVDEAPVAGENRYYVRVEQNDGSMAWSSPVWVTVKAGAE